MKDFDEQLYEEAMLKYGFALDVLETNIRILLNEYEYRNKNDIVDHIKVRLKTKESAIKKLQKKGYDVTVENLVSHVHDMVGLRIICPFLSDVYTVVDMIKKYKLLTIKDEKDYISNPKDTGYMSYHFIVLIPVPLQAGIEYIEAEIQVRTMAMAFWASLDHKLQYKFTGEIPEDVKKEIFKCSVDIKQIDEKMLALKEFIKKYMDKN